MGLAYAKRFDVSGSSILEKVRTAFNQGCLGEDRLGICARRKPGSDTNVYSSILIGPQGSTPIVLKFWFDHCPLRELANRVLTAHNNYVTLREMKEQGLFRMLVVPKMHYSFVETASGVFIALPTDKHVAMASVGDIEETRNQLIVLDDLTQRGRWRIQDISTSSNLPVALQRAVDEDVLRIYAAMPHGAPGSSMGFIYSALFLIESDPPQVAIGDIDKLALIFPPERIRKPVK